MDGETVGYDTLLATGLGSIGEGQLGGFDAEEVERHAMMGGRAMGADGFAVGTGGIAFVTVPSVHGIVLMEGVHVVVAIGFGQDAGSGNGEVLGITLDDGLVRQGLITLETVPVDDEGLGTHFEGVEGTVHGQDGGTQDVDAVDLGCGDDAQPPCDGVTLDDGTQLMALSVGELLAIGDEGVGVVVGQDDSGGVDAARQTTPAGFVATGFDQVGMIV